MIARPQPPLPYFVPSLTLAKGAFDVAASPRRSIRYCVEEGYNVDECGVPTCVHPEKVGLPPGKYIGSNGDSIDDVDGSVVERPRGRLAELEQLIAGLALNTDPALLEDILADVEDAALARFPQEEVVEAFRRALTAAASAASPEVRG